MPTAKRLLPLLIALTLAGCAAPPSKHRVAPLISEADGRFRSGDFSGASQVYQRLAEQSEDADYYRLLAADSELRAGNDRAAQTLLSVVKTDELDEGDQQRYALLRSRIDLNQGKAREAMARLDGITYEKLTTAMRAHYHTLRASAFNQLGNWVECARERVYYGQLTTNPEAVQKNNEAIYDALNRLPNANLADQQAKAQQGTLRGWLALVIAARSPAASRAAALQSWRSNYTGHPANGSFVLGLIAQKPQAVEVMPLKPVVEAPPAVVQTPPPAPPPPTAPAAPTPEPPPAVNNGFVGVLLPLTGQYAIAGQTVRAGLQAASSADTNPNKPELRFVDTQTSNVGALYQTFASQGAKFVIGPLTKEEVTTLSAVSDIPVPVLALNQIDGLNRDKLYQFALTPEQEVEQAASLAWFDGRQNALLLAPATTLGQRLVTHFTGYWKSLGGKIASVRTYPSGAADYSGTAKQLLAGVSGDSTSQIAPEFIFLIANSNDGRLLNPHIINQQTGKIPIYATSMIFNGQPEAPQNNDLSGVTFCDSPWLLNTDSDPLSRKSMQPTVRQTPELYLRLLPMGIDAYQLSQELGPLKAGLSRYNGATGVLSLRSGNHIQRQLHCAQFDGPTLQPRGIAPTLQPGLTAPTP